MNTMPAEVKIRYKGDERRWEDIPVTIILDVVSNVYAIYICQVLADGLQGCVWIRWNWKGSLQGDYRHPGGKLPWLA